MTHRQHLELLKKKLAEEKAAIGSVKKIFTAGLLDKSAARKIDASVNDGETLGDNKFSNNKLDVS